jgi:hypothetical protein
MGAGTWIIGAKAKKYIMNNTITLGAGVFKMCLVTTAGSAHLSAFQYGTISTWASIVNEVTGGGYTANGKNIVPATGYFTTGASARSMKFGLSTVGLSFTANGSSIVNIRYAVIRNSTGAGAGKGLMYVALTTTQYSLTSPNILTVKGVASPAGALFTFA